jgi:Family of unknown function (DUF5681)
MSSTKQSKTYSSDCAGIVGSRKSAANSRGRPFQPGNSGKPKGTRHKVTRAVEALLEGEAEGLTRKAIEKALEGDMTAIRLCLDRICPVRRDPPIAFDLPSLGSASDAVAAMSAVTAGVAEGEITPSEAGELSKLVDVYARTLLASDLEARVAKLEKRK